MGLELARAFITVGATTTPALNSFNDLRSRVDSDMEFAAESVDDFGSTVRTVMNDIRTAILGTLTVIERFTRSWRDVGQAQAASFEETQIAFDTMLGSAEETKKTLDALTEFAAKTPFEMPEILQAARGLIQFGERGDDLIKTLNLLGNAAAGTSTDFGMVALIFNQIRGVGKLLTQDFRQLSTRGILSLQDIADHYKVGTAEAQEMISSGVGFDDLTKILEKLSSAGGRFANLMERQSHSMKGLQSTLNDSVNILKRTIGIPINEWAKPFLSIMIDVTGRMTEMALQFPEITAGAFLGAEAFAKLGIAILGANFAMRLFGVTLKTALIGTGIGVGIVLIGAAIGALIGPAMGAVKAFWALEPVQEAVTRTTAKLSEAWERIKIAFFNTVDALKPLLSGLMDFLGIDLASLGDSVLEFTINIVDWFADTVLQLAIFAQNISSNWSGTWEMIKTGAFTALSYVLDVAENVWANITEVGFAAWNALSQSAEIFVAGAVAAWGHFTEVSAAVFNLIMVSGAAAFNSLTQVFMAAVMILESGFAILPNLAAASFHGIATIAFGLWIAWAEGATQMAIVFEDVLVVIGRLFAATFNAMVRGIGSFVSQISKIPHLIKTVVTGGDVLAELAGMSSEIGAAMGKGIEEAKIGEALERTGRHAKETFQTVGRNMETAFQGGLRAFDQAGGNKALAQFGKEAKEAAQYAGMQISSYFTSPEMQQSLDWVKKSTGSLVDSISDSAGKIGDSFNKAFSAINLKPLMQASDATKRLAKETYDMFSGLWYTEPPLPDAAKLQAEKDKTDNTKKKKEEDAAKGKEKKGFEIGYDQLTSRLQDMLYEKNKDQEMLGEAQKQTEEAKKQTDFAKDTNETIKNAVKDGKGPLVFRGVPSSIGGGGLAEGKNEKLTTGASIGFGLTSNEDFEKQMWDAYYGGESGMTAADIDKMMWDAYYGEGGQPSGGFTEGLQSFIGGALGSLGLGQNTPSVEDSQPLLNENEKQTGYLRDMLNAIKGLSMGLT